MIGSIIFINLVGFTKNAMLNRIHTKGAETLQTALYENFRDNEKPKPEPKASTFEQDIKKTLTLAQKNNQALKELKQMHRFFPSPKPRSPDEDEHPETRPRSFSAPPPLSLG